MESFDWANVDWATWGPPLAVLLLGIVGGLALVARGGARAEGDLRLANLEVRRQVLMNSLRELEADQAKLDPSDYAAQRTALVEEAAAVLRQIDTPLSPTPSAGPTGAPRVGGSRAWAWAAAVLVFFVLSGVVLQQAMAPRRDGGSMTGNQDLGGGGAVSATVASKKAKAS